jgi:hypothetical protein
MDMPDGPINRREDPDDALVLETGGHLSPSCWCDWAYGPLGENYIHSAISKGYLDKTIVQQKPARRNHKSKTLTVI